MQEIAPTSSLRNPNGHTETDVRDALTGQSGTRRWSFRYELLDATNTKVQDLTNVVSGSVAQNWLADIKRTATFKLREVDWIDYLSDRIKPWVRLHLPPYGDDDWVEWPQGVFMLSTPTRAASDLGVVTRDVDGYDLLQILADDKVADRYTVTAGTAYTTAILQLIPSTETANVAASTLTLPVDAEWDPGTSKLKIANELLSAINYESLSVDEDGIYQIQPYRSPQDRPAEWTYADDHEGLVIPGVDQTLDLFSIPNRWVLSVSEPDRDPISGSYQNDDPASLTSTVRRGRVITDFRTQQDAADEDTLTELARRLGQQASQVYEAIDFSTGLMPIHSGNDVYRITYGPLALDDVYAEHTWDLDLREGAPMRHRARRVVVLP